MQKYGLGKTQVRRFAETHGVRIKKAKGGRANLYLKADWEAARKKAEKTSASTSKGQESFLDYFRMRMNESTNKANRKAAYKHFENYAGGECHFCDLSVTYCQKFLDYMVSDKCKRNDKLMMSTTANRSALGTLCLQRTLSSN